MKLARVGPPGQEHPAVLVDGVYLDVTAFGRDFDEAFFADEGIVALAGFLEDRRGSLPRVPDGSRLGPPVARPSKIICVGLNFRDHAAESGMAIPAEPVLFFKSTTALGGPNDPVRIPRGGSKLDWEVELAVVIGRRACGIDFEHSAQYVAGYALHNDYSERTFQLERGGQWVKGKSADTFAPLGPFLATRDEIPDPHALDMWLRVNGTVRQQSTTANMIFGVFTLVSYVSQFMTLLPGDIISTGTPAGVALGMRPEPVYLRPGDEVELGIEGLGRARQKVMASA